MIKAYINIEKKHEKVISCLNSYDLDSVNLDKIVSQSAVKKLIELKAAEPGENSFLRMGVKPGGCSGLSYEMFFDTERSESDIFESYEGVEIGLDSQSLQHIKGSTLDYKEGLMETGFSIDNPNATRTCGCGDSFS